MFRKIRISCLKNLPVQNFIQFFFLNFNSKKQTFFLIHLPDSCMRLLPSAGFRCW